VDAGSPSDCDFPTAERFRSSRVPRATNARVATVAMAVNEVLVRVSGRGYPHSGTKETRPPGSLPPRYHPFLPLDLRPIMP
jgi:hypothetical protein